MKNKKNLFIVCVAVAVLMIGFFTVRALVPQKSNSEGTAQSAATVSADGDMVIQKSKVTATPSFLSYNVNGTKMEVIAVKAPDGTVRTAFNTCQVCYSSGRGYYKLDGNTLVCQNCGNRFTTDQIEQQKGGCNPVAITKEYKAEPDQTITLKKDFFAQTQQLFANWKK